MNGSLDWIEHVDLPARWRGRERFVVFEAGIDSEALIDAWHRVWRADVERCAQLHIVVVDGHATGLTPNIHRRSLDDGAFVALIVPMALDAALAELVAQVDVFHLGKPVDHAPPIDRRALKAFRRLGAEGAVIVLDAPEHALRAGLVTAGFRFDAANAAPRAIGTFAPQDFRHRVHAQRHRGCSSTERRAIVIGAGLAGCASAWALAECGWRSTVVDAHPEIAAEASGHVAGLFHGIFNAQDGRHARLHRAAALEAAKAVRVAIDAHGASGAIDGVLRRESAEADARTMQSAIDALALPPHYVEALDAKRMSDAAGIVVAGAGWLYRSGGWVDPAALARSFIARAGASTELQLGRTVERLRRAGSSWQLVAANGNVIDHAETVVLANAHAAIRLLNTIEGAAPNRWPLTRVRGQLSVMPASAWPHGRPPRLPLTGSGYVAAIDAARVMFGATAQAGDDDRSVRCEDHLANLRRLDTWVAGAGDIDPRLLEGRTAWRCVADDRMPVIGAVPMLADGSVAEGDAGGDAVRATRLDQPRFVPREPGLFVYTALGSRGITWAALGAETLAALVSGAPCPIEASLLDAVDPARFVSRHARRGG